MNISFLDSDKVDKHLNQYSICRKSLEGLGRELVKKCFPGQENGNLNGTFNLISVGYGSTTKFRFAVKEGGGENAPILKSYFIRIPHDPNKSKEQIEKENARLNNPLFKSLPFIYQSEGDNFFVDSLDKRTKIDVGVFSWADDRSKREMISLDEFTRKKPITTDQEFCNKLSSCLKSLANGIKDTGKVTVKKITLNEETFPASYWLDWTDNFTWKSDGVGNQPTFNLASILPVKDEKSILCLKRNGEEYWLRVKNANLKDDLKVNSTLKLDYLQDKWKPYHQILIDEDFLSSSVVDGNAHLDSDRSRDYRRVCCHNDLHPGNILVSKCHDNTTDILFIDFCDVDEEALAATDFAFLAFTLCLAQAKEAKSLLANIFQLLKFGSKTEVENSALYNVLSAIKSAQDAVTNEWGIPIEEVHFTYWFVAHKYLRYAMLEDRSVEYKEVVRRWMDFWDPKANSDKNLISQFNGYAQEIAGYWEQQVYEDDSKDPADKLFDERRLDCYVPPQLSWITRISDLNWSNFNLEPLHGEREKQPVMAFLECLKNSRRLLITERGGSGKSLLAIKLASELSALKDDNELPYLVFFWRSQLPNGSAIFDCLLRDERYLRFCNSGESLLSFALEKQRVVVILDGYDELTDRSVIEDFFKSPDPRLEHVYWVLLGRQYGFVQSNHALEIQSDRRASKWKCLSIEPFSDDQVVEYVAKTKISPETWKTTVSNIDPNERKQILSLPSNVSSLARLIEHYDNHNFGIPTVESGSDLFLQLFELSINREIEKHQLSKSFKDLTKAYEWIAEAVACIAFQMAVRGFYRAVETSGNQSPSVVMQDITNGLKKQFEKRQDFLELLFKLLDRLVRDKWGIIAPKSPSIYAFNHRLTLEYHCANFLATYANESDIDAAAKHVGNNSWNTIWSALIKMPLYNPQNRLLGFPRLLGACLEVYKNTLRLLFKRPDPTSKFRRPTRLMFDAISWLELFQFDKRMELRQTLISELRGQRSVAPHDDNIISHQFIEIETGASATHSLRLSKYPVLNSEYRLFDPVERPSDNAPAQMCSWYDALMFCLFSGPIEIGGQSLDCSLPLPSELMHCIDRVKLRQNDGIPSLTELFCDYESKNFDIVHAKSDCLGLVGLFNSGFEWCLIQDALRSADKFPLAGQSDLTQAEGKYDPWPNPYYIVPGLRPKDGRFNHVTFRLAVRPSLAKEPT